MNQPSAMRPGPGQPDDRPLHRRKRIWFGGFTLFTLGAVIATTGNGGASADVGAAPRATVTATATATVTAVPKAAPAPTVTKTRTVKKPGPTVTVRVTEAAQAAAGSDDSGSSDTGTCSIVSNAGNCYEAGQFCRNGDHGAVTTDAGGDRIKCVYRSNAWRWSYA
ncbi:hypothetical protein ABZ471_26925 [Streptomyces sp. NPDC005728]|uniref:hypothetical protein n=1 Tax=Streptomyces sp. NPDC005728 TaxID=3157054 RepID=UPI0033F1FE09